MRNASWMALSLAGVLATGCGGGKGTSAAGALDDVPDAQALTLEVTGGAEEQGAVAAAPSAMAAVAADPAWPVTGDDLAAARSKIAAVNAALRKAIAHVEAVAVGGGAPVSTQGGGRWYGPIDRCTVDVAVGSACPEGAAANLRLWIGRGPLGYAGAFLLQARPYGADDEAAWKTVAAGTLARGVHLRRGHGKIWIDLDQLKSVAPAYVGRGKLYGGFSAGPVAKAETLVLHDFTPDATNPAWPAATVAFRGFKSAAGTARVRVAALEDYVATTDDTELGLFHVAYNAAVGGRAFAVVTDYTADATSHGDVPADHYFFGRACYAAGAPTTPVFKQWFLCPKAQSPVACAADAGNASAIEIGTSWSACALPGDPAEFAPPTSAPGMDPAQLPGALPGEDASGETADAPPVEGDPLPSAS